LPPAPTGFWAEGCSTSLPGDLVYKVALNSWLLEACFGLGGTHLGGQGTSSTEIAVSCGGAVMGFSCRDGNAICHLKGLYFRLKGAGRYFFLIKKKAPGLSRSKRAVGVRGGG